MNNQFQAATIIRQSNSNTIPRFVVIIDANAANIMGETKLRYLFGSMTGAKKFVSMLQNNLDAAYADIFK